MKPKKILKLTAFLLIFAVTFASCKEPDPEPVDSGKPSGTKYPIDIPFTEYLLAGTSCQWVNLNYDDKLIVVNSNEELKNYINCSKGNYPEIDFSKHTLLLANGTTPNGIVEISKRLLQLSANKYRVDIEILLDETEITGRWVTALIVSKLSKESDIEINVRFKEFEGSSSIYYIVGYDCTCDVEIIGETAKAEVYLIVSENLADTLATKNLPDDLFAFPVEIMPTIHGRFCEFAFFPQKYRFTYKVHMTYRAMTIEELNEARCVCFDGTPLYYIEPEYIVITSISKIE